jgi:hypothetical protein
MTLSQIEQEAAKKYPISPNDCRIEKARKQGLRKEYIERLKKESKLANAR